MKTIASLFFALICMSQGLLFGQCDPITSFPFSETFEDSSPTRDCWTQQQVLGNNSWTFATGTQNGSPGYAYEGDYHARFTDDGNGEITKLISPVFDLSAYSSSCILTFYYAQASWSGDQNVLKVYFRTGTAAPWILLFTDNANRTAWTYKSLELPAPSATYQIAFEGTDNYGYANMLDLVSILPPCAPVTQFPFTETFENNSPTRYCWLQEVVNGNKSWGFEAGAIEGAVQTAHSGELNACFTNDWGMNYVTRLISPVFDLTGATYPYNLSFYYAQEENDGSQNYLNVYYRPGPAAGWMLLFSDSTNRPGWTLASMNLPSASATYQLAFEGSANGGFANVIDKVMISSCSIPQMVHITDITAESATVNWMSGGFEYQWELKTGEAGFNPDISGDHHPGLTAYSFGLSGLDAGTLYDVYIRPVCTPGNQNPWIGPYRFNTQYTLPYFEDFDETWLTPLPPGWNKINLTQISWHNPVIHVVPSGYSEPNCVLLDDCVDYKKSPVSDETQVEEVILISPEMPLALNQLRVSFMASTAPNSGACGIPQLAVGTMQNPTAYNTFTEYQLITLNSDWQSFTVNFNNYTGSDPYIAFRLVFSDMGFGRILMDDIEFSVLPTCLEPTDLQYSILSETEISLQWIPGQNESSWDIMYGPAGFTQGTLIQDVTEDPMTVGNLQPAMQYDFYVRANCGNGDYSDWTGPVSVAMPCGAVSAPIHESFDLTAENMLPNCWSSIATMPSGVLTVTDMNTSEPHALMMLNDPAAQDTVYFVTPMLTNPINSLMISFNAYAYGWGNTFTLGTLSEPTDPTTFTPIFDFIQIPEYTEWAWDFYDYTGTDAYIAFRLTEDAAILLDDIVIEVPFVCQMPESVSIQSLEPNTVTISWTAVNQETSWNVIFGEPGFDPSTQGTLLEGITENPFTLNDLNQGQAYDIYVSALCSNGDWSDWAGPATFTTPCTPQPIPFLESFEGLLSGSLPECWLTTNENGDETTWTVGDDGSGSNTTVLITPPNGQIPHNDWFFSPPFLLLAGHTYTVSFDYKADQANPNNQIAVYIGSSANPAAMNISSLFSTSVSNIDYANGSFSFMPAADGIQVFGWYCMSGSPQSTMFIDNISITEALQTTCPQNLFACTGGFPILLIGATPIGGVYSGAYVYQNQNQEYVFDPSTLSAGQYVVTYTYSTPFASSSCDFIIIVSEPPTVTCPPEINITPDADPFLLSGGNPAGGNFYGQAVVNNMFNPGMATMGSNSVLYMYTDPVTLCQGFCSFNVNMNEVVNMICPPDFSLCVGASSVILSGASPAGGVYSGAGVYQGQNQEYIFDPALAGFGNHTITYTYTTQFGVYTCTFIATVNALPAITCPPDINFCWGNPPLTLTGGIPAGGIYSGPGVSGTTFDPNSAGLGSHVITYTYTNANNCSTLCEFSINVINGQLLSVTMVADTLNACMGDNVTFQAVTQNAGQNPLIQWYVNTQLQATTGQTLVISPQVNSDVYCVVSSFEPCTMGNPATSNSMTVNVFPSLFPTISISADDDTVCEGTLVTYHVVAVADTGSNPIFQWQVNGMNVGTNSQSYSYIPGNADLVKCMLIVNEPCVSQSPVNSNIITTVIIPTPFVQLSFPVDSMCINWDPVLLTGGIPTGGIYTGNGIVNQTFNPALAGAGNHPITYTYTDNWGCTGTATANTFVDLCTQVTAYTAKNPILIYPNPANNRLVIKPGNASVYPEIIRITDLTGKIEPIGILNQDNSEIILDIHELSPGLYTLQINTEYFKFMIIR